MAEVQIAVVEGPNAGKEFDLSGATTVGRDPSADIVIDDPEASRRHASLSVEGDTVTVEDLGSTNGTFVNGQRLTAAQTLGKGDKLRIGTTVFELRVEEEEVQATRVGTELPDLDDLQVTAPRQVPDFAKEEPPAAEPAAPEPEPAAPEPAAPEPAQPTTAGVPVPPAPTNAPPPSAGPPGGAGGPPGGPPPGPPPGGPPPPPGGPPPPPAAGPPPPSAPPAYAPPPGPPAPYAGAGMVSASAYPFDWQADYPEAGIANWRPLVQGLMAIPHFFVLFFIFIAGYFAFIGAWFSILFTRRYPPGIFNFLTGAMQWAARVSGYTYLMTEQYPPFAMGDQPYPVRARFQYPEGGISRWRVFFQGFLALPHFFIIYFLGIAAYIAHIVTWFSILFTRRYPPGIFNFTVGVMRWQTRVFGYLLLMTEEYPPFSLE